MNQKCRFWFQVYWFLRQYNGSVRSVHNLSSKESLGSLADIWLTTMENVFQSYQCFGNEIDGWTRKADFGFRFICSGDNTAVQFGLITIHQAKKVWSLLLIYVSQLQTMCSNLTSVFGGKIKYEPEVQILVSALSVLGTIQQFTLVFKIYWAKKVWGLLLIDVSTETDKPEGQMLSDQDDAMSSCLPQNQEPIGSSVQEPLQSQ